MFILKEIQTNEEGIPAFLPEVTRETRQEIESAFYLTCGSAVISSIPVHTIMVFTEEGFVIPELTKCFKHYSD